MDALLGGFAAYQRRRNLSPATIDSYARVLRRWCRHVDPFAATHLDVESFLTGGPAHRKWLISALAGFYRWAIRDGHTDHDPTVKVDRPKLPRRLPRPITPADLGMALELAPLRLRVVLALAAFAGLRCKEIAGLCWEHVGPRGLLVVEAKGGDERVVPLHPYLAMVLDEWGRGAGPVLGNQRVKARRNVRRQRVSQMGNDYLASMGITATMHQLRHFFGTETWRAMVLSGTPDLLVLRDLMGHRSTVMTEGYTKVVVDERAAAAVAAVPVPMAV